MQLAGRVAAITGGTSSIGAGIARACLAEGASVALMVPSGTEDDPVLAGLGTGDRTLVVPGDTSAQADVEGFIDATVERYGRIDVLVNNAGGAAPGRSLVEVTDEEWDLVLHRVLYSAFWATRRALRVMIPERRGRIINVSANDVDRGGPPSPVLAAALSAVEGLTRSVAAAVADTGITVNSLCPGVVLADGPTADSAGASGVRRANTVEEVAAIALLMASDAGGSITGAVVRVEGGAAHY